MWRNFVQILKKQIQVVLHLGIPTSKYPYLKSSVIYPRDPGSPSENGSMEPKCDMRFVSVIGHPEKLISREYDCIPREYIYIYIILKYIRPNTLLGWLMDDAQGIGLISGEIPPKDCIPGDMTIDA